MSKRLHITKHAIERFREHVIDLPPDAAFDQMLLCLATAKPKHLKKAMRKNTAYVPLGCCHFICSKGSVVTVIKTPRAA